MTTQDRQDERTMRSISRRSDATLHELARRDLPILPDEVKARLRDAARAVDRAPVVGTRGSSAPGEDLR